MDDALSSVDSDTETAILTNLRGLRSSRTIVIVSHRVSALQLADRVAVMEGGTVVEAGSHKPAAARARALRPAGGAAASSRRRCGERIGERSRYPAAGRGSPGSSASPAGSGSYVLGHKALVAASLVAMLSTDLLHVTVPALVKLGIDRDIAAGDLRGLRTTALLLAAGRWSAGSRHRWDSR